MIHIAADLHLNYIPAKIQIFVDVYWSIQRHLCQNNQRTVSLGKTGYDLYFIHPLNIDSHVFFR